MKRELHFSVIVFLFVSFFCHFFLASNLCARNVSFTWTANTDVPAINGYKLYYKVGDPGPELAFYYGSNAAGDTSSPIEIVGQGTTSYILYDLLDSEKYSFVLTAYRGSDESPPTSEIVLDPITPPPGDLNARIIADTVSGENPLTVYFDGSASTGDIVSYEWTYGDGSQKETGSMASHIFDSAGEYTTTLKVTDSVGGTDTETVTISVVLPPVENIAPEAVISSSVGAGAAPLSVNFDGSGSSDPDGDSLTYLWDFGDGNSGTGATSSHVYSSPGMFTAKLTVKDPGGLTDSETLPVIVSNPVGDVNKPPTAVISANPNKGIVPLSVTFNAGQSFDPDGSVVSYTWNFGDGSSSNAANVTHTFLQPASYSVTLKVKDNQGASSSIARYTVKVLEEGEEGSLPEEGATSITPVLYLLLNSPPVEEDPPQE